MTFNRYSARAFLDGERTWLHAHPAAPVHPDVVADLLDQLEAALDLLETHPNRDAQADEHDG